MQETVTAGDWRPWHTKLPALLLVVGLGSVLLGCAGEDDRRGASFVKMLDNAFSPPVLRVPVGTEVVWVNVGRNPHNALADDGSWVTNTAAGESVLQAGEKAAVSFADAGVFPYFCSFHGAPGGVGMAGTVVVGEGNGAELAGLSEELSVKEASGTVRRVPDEYPTIQAGVDAAEPGDLILIAAGVYREEVVVTTPSLVIRGVDRNAVIIDGETLRGNGVMALADGVAVENLTVRNAILNGLYWSGVTGYRASYITAVNNQDYGVYAFDSVDGLFENSYASGSPDAGFYIGQCQPCRAIIRGVVSEHNALGYSGTNAGGELYIVSSVFRNNQVGIVPNTLDSELLPPVRSATVAANLVVDNNNRNAPAKPLGGPGFGNGILISGGLENRVERNLVIGHEAHGILLAPAFDRNFWVNQNNVVRRNHVLRSGRADLAIVGPGSSGNCFEGNTFESSSPAGIETLEPCSGLRLPVGYDLGVGLGLLIRIWRAEKGLHPHGESASQPLPGPQPSLPGGGEAPVRPAVDVFESLAFELSQAELPPEAARYRSQGELADPAATQAGRPPSRLIRGIDLAGAFGPLSLCLLWSLCALADVVRRRDLEGRKRVAWVAAVALLPWLGAGAYLSLGGARISAGRRALILLGSLAAYLLTLGISGVANGLIA